MVFRLSYNKVGGELSEFIAAASTSRCSKLSVVTYERAV